MIIYKLFVARKAMVIKMKKEILTTEIVEGPASGKGKAVFNYMLDEGELPENAEMMAILELNEGTEIGYHKHTGEGELYYIIDGKGLYCDDGKEYEVESGSSTYCYDGHSHGLKNTGAGKLKMAAVIVKE